MKELSLNELTIINGGSCVGETVGAGVAAATIGLFTGGPVGAVAGWLTGSVGGLIKCAITEAIEE